MNHLNWRYSMMLFLFGVISAVIVGRLIQFQFFKEKDDILSAANDYSGTQREVIPARGLIMDQNHHILAGNKLMYEVGVDLNQVKNPEDIARVLHDVLELDYQTVLTKIGPVENAPAVSIPIQNFVTLDKAKKLLRLRHPPDTEDAESIPQYDLRGLSLYPFLQRSYPEQDLASNIIGFVGGDGKGYFGVEEQYDALLTGQVLTIWFPEDPLMVEELPDIPPGTSIVLSIHREIQAEMERILDQAVAKNGSTGGAIIVLNPKNGELLAIATSERINLNKFWQNQEMIRGSLPFNRGVSSSYESGSVFKIFTMSAALDNGDVEPDTVFVDTGSIEIGGVMIQNWDRRAWGPQTMVGCLQHSLNVCLAWVAKKLGSDDFYPYMQKFGFGFPTNVDLAGEVTGILRLPGSENWYAADLGTNSFGQGLSVTPVQLVMAAGALANGGQMITPHVIRGMITNKVYHEIEPQLAGIPVSAETARTITNMLYRSLENEASSALVEGYKLAGKTGTAEIPTSFGYTTAQTNASFLGWGPIGDPQFVVFVWFEKPTTSIWGSTVAAPVFSEAVEHLVVLMGIPPDKTREELSNQ